MRFNIYNRWEVDWIISDKKSVILYNAIIDIQNLQLQFNCPVSLQNFVEYEVLKYGLGYG
jgi:hypothetical protein